jgi:membrane protein YqaA with SNARE-associated domain
MDPITFQHLVLAWATVLLINIVPAFMPPTWSVASFFFIQFELPLLPLTLGSAIASTIGRVILASAAGWIGPRLMTEEMRRNTGALEDWLAQRNPRRAVSLVFAAPISPFPSNQLFLAAGLARLDLRIIAPAFFVGRVIEYTVAVSAARVSIARFSELFGDFPILLFQLFGLASLVILLKAPWARMLQHQGSSRSR